MGLNKYELKTVSIVLAAVLVFIVTRMIHYTISFFYNPSYFLITHTILEIFSVFVSYTIFFYGWLSLQQSLTSRRLHLSLVFLAVGCFSLIHTLSYKGMPFFQADNPYPIPTYLWIVERLVESIGFGLVMVNAAIDRKISSSERYVKLVITAMLIFVVTYIVINYSDKFPDLIIEGQGVTLFKRVLEYIVSGIHLITLVYFMNHYRKTKDRNILTISQGIIFVLIGGLVFTLYRNVYDMDNLLGHIYKTIGYFFILKGVFFPQLQQVFNEKEKATTQLELVELQSRNNDKRWTSTLLEAQEKERAKVSEALYSSANQSLASLVNTIQMAKTANADGEAASYLSVLEKLSKEAKSKVEFIAFNMRPITLDDKGLFTAIDEYLDYFERSEGIKVNYEVNGEKQRFSTEIETVLFRILQEALDNSAKYANTRTMRIKLSIMHDTIQMVVIDEGKGFKPEEIKVSNRMGFGLFMIKEQAERVGGTVEVQSIEGVGTRIQATIPNK